jgi:hypothetical protein
LSHTQSCLEDKEQYLQRRNAIIIIGRLVDAHADKSAPPVSPCYLVYFSRSHELVAMYLKHALLLPWHTKP